MGKAGCDAMAGAAGMRNCAACPDTAEETDLRGGRMLRCLRRGLRGEYGRVVCVFPEGRRETERQEPPAWCERRQK